MKQKAYTAYINFDTADINNNLDIIFAKSTREAKDKFMTGTTFYGNEWKLAKNYGARRNDINVYRAPELDDYENSTIMEMGVALAKFGYVPYYDPITQEDLMCDSFTEMKQKQFETGFISDCKKNTVPCNQCNEIIKMEDIVYYTDKPFIFCSIVCLSKSSHYIQGVYHSEKLHTYFNYY